MKISLKEQNNIREKNKSDGKKAFLDGKAISSNPFAFNYDSMNFRAWCAGYMEQHDLWLKEHFDI